MHLPINNLLFHKVLSTKWMNGQEQTAPRHQCYISSFSNPTCWSEWQRVWHPTTEKFPSCYQMFITLLKKIKSRYVAFLTPHCESIWGRRFVTDINSLKMYWSPSRYTIHGYNIRLNGSALRASNQIYFKFLQRLDNEQIGKGWLICSQWKIPTRHWFYRLMVHYLSLVLLGWER